MITRSVDTVHHRLDGLEDDPNVESWYHVVHHRLDGLEV
ncbi:hypothetical protein L289_4119 [Acinetobacter gerneri DSM 14967 = CIP 107464 = MTCC 9824]|nr:hypothetical protein L289_4119 [Acinetobacter gerneri DSM 14967 = CIP 107464 = MTCC 9824]